MSNRKCNKSNKNTGKNKIDCNIGRLGSMNNAMNVMNSNIFNYMKLMNNCGNMCSNNNVNNGSLVQNQPSSKFNQDNFTIQNQCFVNYNMIPSNITGNIPYNLNGFSKVNSISNFNNIFPSVNPIINQAYSVPNYTEVPSKQWLSANNISRNCIGNVNFIQMNYMLNNNSDNNNNKGFNN